MSTPSIEELVAAFKAKAEQEITAKSQKEACEADDRQSRRQRVREALQILMEDLRRVYEPLITAGLARVDTEITFVNDWAQAHFEVNVNGHQTVSISAFLEKAEQPVRMSSNCWGDQPLYVDSTVNRLDIVIAHAAYAGKRQALHEAGKPGWY